MSFSKKLALFLNSLIIIFFASITFSFDSPNTFSPGEHLALGDEIKLFFSTSDTGHTSQLLPLPNGLHLTYGDIISLGDFYGVVEQPVSQGKNDVERQMRFLAAFNTLATNTESFTEANKLHDAIHNEKEIIEKAVQNGEKPEVAYKRISQDSNRQYNCITGGGCASSGWWLIPGRYLTLSNENFDHFGLNAWMTYQAGHAVALKEAVAAHQTNDVKRLEYAYIINAFACHFLSDRFAAGHLRTPRIELYTYVKPATVGSALSNFMHNEENANGLHVHNQRGDHWIAFGDTFYFSKNNHDSNLLIHEALQLSANEIFSAYLKGYAPPVDNVLSDLLPQPDEKDNNNDQDISPLFYWDNSLQKLMRRKDLENVFDRHFTIDWWGWSTLSLLSKQHGLPSEAQAALVSA